MSLNNLVLYSLAIVAITGMLIVGISYLAYSFKKPQRVRRDF